MKKIFALSSVFMLLFCLCACTQSPYTSDRDSTLTVSVCAVDDEGNYLLEKTDIPYTEGITAFDALLTASKQSGVKVVHSSRYVTEIGTLAAGDKGEMSGWLYFVNEESPTVGASDFVLSAGDTLLWQYTC